MQIAFPLEISDAGRTREVAQSDHVKDLIRQVLFTTPGERVNRPTFGCDLRSIVFANRRNELSLAVETMVHGALQQWLGDVVSVQTVDIKPSDDGVIIDLNFVELRTDRNWFVRFVS